MQRAVSRGEACWLVASTAEKWRGGGEGLWFSVVCARFCVVLCTTESGVFWCNGCAVPLCDCAVEVGEEPTQTCVEPPRWVLGSIPPHTLQGLGGDVRNGFYFSLPETAERKSVLCSCGVLAPKHTLHHAFVFNKRQAR